MSLSDVEIMGGVGFGYDQFQDPYSPIQQEPMGRSFRPDQFGSSLPAKNYYEYPKWNPEDPIRGIDFEMDNIRNSNALTVENHFQTQTAKYGQSDDISKTRSRSAGLNSNLADTVSLLRGRESFIPDSTIFGVDTTVVILILILLICVVLAYSQHMQIRQLQNILETVIKRSQT